MHQNNERLGREVVLKDGGVLVPPLLGCPLRAKTVRKVAGTKRRVGEVFLGIVMGGEKGGKR